jgi:hypothetical protein
MLFHFAYGAMGAAGTRLSLRPLLSEGHVFAPLGRELRRENAKTRVSLAVIASASEAIQTLSAATVWIASARTRLAMTMPLFEN